MFANVADEQATGLPSIPELRRQIIKFDRIVRKNAEMRSKYMDEPTKYVTRSTITKAGSRIVLLMMRYDRPGAHRYLESETDLDRAFAFLYPLPQNPLTYYPEILKNELLLPDLIQLLSHDNTDIALQVVGALYEMTDEDVGEDAVEAEEDEEEKERMGTRLRLIMGDFIGLLVSPSVSRGSRIARSLGLADWTSSIWCCSLTTRSWNSSSPI